MPFIVMPLSQCRYRNAVIARAKIIPELLKHVFNSYGDYSSLESNSRSHIICSLASRVVSLYTMRNVTSFCLNREIHVIQA